MEKISVNVYHNSGVDYYTIRNEAALNFTQSDCDYIRERNLSSVEIEAEYINPNMWSCHCYEYNNCQATHCSACGESRATGEKYPNGTTEKVLVPKLYDGFVKVICEPKELSEIEKQALYDEPTFDEINKLDVTVTNPVKDEELEAGNVMSAREYYKCQQESNTDYWNNMSFWEHLESYAKYRAQAENLQILAELVDKNNQLLQKIGKEFTKQDIENIINSYLYFLMEDSKSGEHEPETGKEWLANFITDYKKNKP